MVVVHDLGILLSQVILTDLEEAIRCYGVHWIYVFLKRLCFG